MRYLRFSLPFALLLTLLIGWQFGGREPTAEPRAGSGAQAATRPSAKVARVLAAVPPLAPLAVDDRQSWFQVSAWTKPKPNLAPLAPGETFASRQVLAVAVVNPRNLLPLTQVKEGQRLQLLVREGVPLMGVVNLVQRDDQGWTRVGGSLEGSQQGGFSLSQKDARWHGMIRHQSAKTAYVLETTETGSLHFIEKPLSSVICEANPRRKHPAGTGGEQADGTLTSSKEVMTASALVSVPALDSLPGASHVIYLDFDGEDVTDPDWNNGFIIHAVPTKLGSSYISEAQITDVWKRVAEDFKPFNISITTLVSRYNAAPAGQRMRCIITETDVAAPGAGGVAYKESYNEAGSGFSSTVPSWAFTDTYYSTDDIAGTISHEVGHTVGLSHDGKYADGDFRHIEYYEGHGSGATSWGPIMGTTYDRVVSQWSKGEYSNASNLEDDLAVIARPLNGFGYRPSGAYDLGNTAATAKALANSGVFDQSGIISAQSDIDFYAFNTAGGSVVIEAVPALIGPDLDILLELRAADGTTVLATANPAGLAKATITKTVTAGSYYLVVRGSGYATPDTGYTTYGSLGEYKLSGTFPAVPDVAPSILTQPVSVAVALGGKATFQVQAISNTPPTYQWTRDNVGLLGQTKSTLVISSVQVASQGDYRCVVTNQIGSTTSDPATLTANYKPVFTLHPVSQTKLAGTAVTFTVTTHGTSTVLYQWQRNGVNIPAANNASLTLNSPQWGDAGSYRCVASNAFGSTNSAAATLTIQSAPVILAQPPATFLAPLNGSRSFSITAAGTGTLSYQWFKGVDKLIGKTSRVLSLTGITAATAGVYHCEVKNLLGTTISQDCAVTVQDSPVMIQDLPSGLTIARGAKPTLSIVVVGAPPLKYLWHKNGLVVGSNSPKLTILGDADADYDVTVSNAFGSATSQTLHVTVHDVPKITVKPLAQLKAYGGGVDFTVVVTGTPPLTYQWLKNKVPMPGAVVDTLTLTDLQATDVASYSVVVTNDVGSAASAGVKLTLQTAPSITTPPVDTTVYAYAPATLTVKAAGTATLKYQWQKNSVNITGATGPSYKIGSAQTTDAANYKVRVSNAVGEVWSSEVVLTVVPASAPIVDSFTPPMGKVGHYVRVRGSYLNWTTMVNFKTSSNVVVKAPFVIVSPDELLVTVPTGAATSLITVTTRGGIASTSSSFQVVATGYTNDDFVNARVIPGSGGKFSGANSGFTGETDEPKHALDPYYPVPEDYTPVYSAWFQWVPSVSGSYYINTRGSGFDTRLAVYTGSSVDALTTVGFNDDEDYDNDIYTSKAYVVVTAGTTYYIAIDGFDFYFSDGSGGPYHFNEYGNYALSITKVADATILASAAKDSWQLQGSGQVTADGDVWLGGAGAAQPALAWLPAAIDADTGVIHCRANLRYDAPTGTVDWLGLTGYGTQSQPLFGLGVAASTGALSTLDATGKAEPTGQTLLPSEPYAVELWVDPVARQWGALLNGIWIAQQLPLPAHASFADFAAQWLPQGGGPHASLLLHGVEISRETTTP